MRHITEGIYGTKAQCHYYNFDKQSRSHGIIGASQLQLVDFTWFNELKMSDFDNSWILTYHTFAFFYHLAVQSIGSLKAMSQALIPTMISKIVDEDEHGKWDINM